MYILRANAHAKRYHLECYLSFDFCAKSGDMKSYFRIRKRTQPDKCQDIWLKEFYSGPSKSFNYSY